MLVPGYICDVVLHPLEDLGIQVKFYPVDDSFVPDWEVLETLQNDGTVHAFLLVHYFGQPQDIERARELCDHHGLWLIEDNAHGHGGTFDGRPLGTFGDLGFSSPRKQLQSPSSGMLYLHGEPVDQTTRDLPGYPVSRGKEFLLFLVRPFPRIKAGLLRMLRPEPDFSNPSAFPEIRMGYYRADPDSVRRILDVNWSILVILGNFSDRLSI